MALQDLLNVELTEDNKKVVVEHIYGTVTEDFARGSVGAPGRSKTLGGAKSLLEFYDLVRRAVHDYEIRSGVSKVDRVTFTEEEPDADSQTESIVFSLVSRQPGQFSQGAPMEAKVKNLRPIIREECEDPENPGYQQAVFGYWYDNVIRFTCWARTNKQANKRAEWFENMMQEYDWWFKLEGVDRVLFWERHADIVNRVDDNYWYGRPLDFYVRTEKLRVFSQKTLEEIIVNLKVKSE